MLGEHRQAAVSTGQRPMRHVMGGLSADAKRNEFVVRPERAVKKEAIGGLDDVFDLGIALPDTGSIAEAWAPAHLADQQRDIVSALRLDLPFQVERHFSGN